MTEGAEAQREFEGRRYRISTDPRQQDPAAVHAFLSRSSYWAEGIPLATVERAMAGSLCFALWCDAPSAPQLAGFARMVTDRATFAYLCDVFVLPEHRGHGAGDWLIASVHAHPDLQGLRRMMLATRDAHRLYARHGYAAVAAPTRLMEQLRPDIYRSTERGA